MRRPFALTPNLFLLGIFVRVDAVFFVPFWIAIGFFSWWMENIWMFVLFGSLFWSVRAFGEIIYWIHEQFAKTHRNDPKNLFGYLFFPDESIYVVYQIFWQCVLVVSIFAAIVSVRNLW